MNAQLGDTSNGEAIVGACRKCNGQMTAGVALQNTLTGSGDFGRADVVTLSPNGPARLVGCRKCAHCGWSVGSEAALATEGEPS